MYFDKQKSQWISKLNISKEITANNFKEKKRHIVLHLPQIFKQKVNKFKISTCKDRFDNNAAICLKLICDFIHFTA